MAKNEVNLREPIQHLIENVIKARGFKSLKDVKNVDDLEQLRLFPSDLYLNITEDTKQKILGAFQAGIEMGDFNDFIEIMELSVPNYSKRYLDGFADSYYKVFPGARYDTDGNELTMEQIKQMLKPDIFVKLVTLKDKTVDNIMKKEGLSGENAMQIISGANYATKWYNTKLGELDHFETLQHMFLKDFPNKIKGRKDTTYAINDEIVTKLEGLGIDGKLISKVFTAQQDVEESIYNEIAIKDLYLDEVESRVKFENRLKSAVVATYVKKALGEDVKDFKDLYQMNDEERNIVESIICEEGETFEDVQKRVKFYSERIKDVTNSFDKYSDALKTKKDGSKISKEEFVNTLIESAVMEGAFAKNEVEFFDPLSRASISDEFTKMFDAKKTKDILLRQNANINGEVGYVVLEGQVYPLSVQNEKGEVFSCFKNTVVNARNIDAYRQGLSKNYHRSFKNIKEKDIHFTANFVTESILVEKLKNLNSPEKIYEQLQKDNLIPEVKVDSPYVILHWNDDEVSAKQFDVLKGTHNYANHVQLCENARKAVETKLQEEKEKKEALEKAARAKKRAELKAKRAEEEARKAAEEAKKQATLLKAKEELNKAQEKFNKIKENLNIVEDKNEGKVKQGWFKKLKSKFAKDEEKTEKPDIIIKNNGKVIKAKITEVSDEKKR